jgi:coenzyme F420-0:L-glutamate ligase
VKELQIFGIKTSIIRPGDNLVSITIDMAKRSGNPLKGRDIIVFSAKAVGTSQNRLVDLSKVKPSKKALAIAEKYHLEPAFAELVLKEADAILGGVEYALLTLKHGVLIANAGVDHSNAPLGYAALWPEDPQKSAEDLRKDFKKAGVDVGVLVIDSRTQPMRMGSSSVAIGSAGFRPVEDLRGRKDLFGRAMKIKRAAIADELASAANLIMGETSESVPIAIIRDAPVKFEEGHTIEEAFIPMDQCLVMHVLKNCRDIEK